MTGTLVDKLHKFTVTVVLSVVLIVFLTVVAMALAVPCWLGGRMLLQPMGLSCTYDQAFGAVLILNSLLLPCYILLAAIGLRGRDKTWNSKNSFGT